MIRRALVLTALSLVTACAPVEGEGEGGADGNGSDANAAWLMGKWVGNLKNRDTAPDVALKETQTKAEFVPYSNEEDKEPRRGVFSFTFPQLSDVKVKGQFDDFAGKSLMLDIDESNLSLIGMKDERPDMDYEIIGGDLLLRNDRVQFRLVRDTGKDEGDKPVNGTGAADPATVSKLAATWGCRDLDGRNWTIKIKNDTAFSADIAQAGAGRLVYEGSVSLKPDDPEKDAVLSVTSSNLDSSVGLELWAKLETATAMRLQTFKRRDGGLVKAEVLACSRS